MARFDKKWLFVHVPASVVVVALIIFGVNQCDGRNDEANEKAKAQQQLFDAGKKMEIAVGKMDSLLAVNRDLGADNVRKGDTIRVLKDSVNTLNDHVRVLKADNDSLTVANDSLTVSLTNCRNSKKKQQPARRPRNNNSGASQVAPDSRPATPSPKPRTENTYVPSRPLPQRSDVGACRRANINVDASYNNGNVVVDNGASETDIVLGNGAVNNGNIVVGNANSVGVPAKRTDVKLNGSYNNGNVVIETAPANADVSLGGRAVNNGAIVVGNANTVYHVTPDTVVRFTTTKNTVVKCRVITKQRQYR